MPKMLTRMMCILVCLGLILASCSNGGSKKSGSESTETKDNGTKTETKTETKSETKTEDKVQTPPKPVTVKLWIHGGYTTYPNRWGKDPVSKYIMEKTGVNFEIMTGDGTNDDTKLNLMISTNDMPDMIIHYKGDLSLKMVADGQLEDLGKLIQQCAECTDLQQLIAESDDISLKYNRIKNGNYWGGLDGGLYGISDYFVDKYTYEHDRYKIIQERNVFQARNDIYEKEGKPNLSNLEDFYNYLKKIKEYKDINGKPVTPLGVMNNGDAVDIFAASFTGTTYPYVFEGDRVSFLYELPSYKETLVFLNRLYRDKLLDQEMFTETYDQWKDKMKAGNIGIIPAWYWHTDGANVELTAKDKNMFYKAMPAEFVPKAPGIDTPIMNHDWGIGLGFGWRTTFIPKSTSDEKKQAILRFLNFMYSHEGQMLQWYGMPGQYYAPAEAWDKANLPKLQDKTMAVEETEEWKKFKEEKGNDMYMESGVAFWALWNINGYGDFTKEVTPDDNDPVAQRTAWNREQVIKLSKHDEDLAKKWDIVSLTAFSNPDLLAVYNAVDQIKTKSFPKMIMASSAEGAAKAYDDMIAEMKTAGLEDLRAGFIKTYKEVMLPLLK